MACHPCGLPFVPARADLDGWLFLDAREDGWTVVVCPDCQTRAERERVGSLEKTATRSRPGTGAV